MDAYRRLYICTTSRKHQIGSGPAASPATRRPVLRPDLGLGLLPQAFELADAAALEIAALGSLQGLRSLGSFLGPPLAGLAYETSGRQSPFWLGIALLVGVALRVAGGLPGQGPGGMTTPIHGSEG